MRVRRYEQSDLQWVEGLLGAELGGRWQARRGELVDVMAYEGLIGDDDGERVGYLSYHRDGSECEIVALAAARRHGGIGTALLHGLKQELSGVERVWLVTTNDNLEALRFYQRRGFRLAALRPGAVDDARRTLKPTIGTAGQFGIPIHDELELEARVDGLAPQRQHRERALVNSAQALERAHGTHIRCGAQHRLLSFEAQRGCPGDFAHTTARSAARSC